MRKNINMILATYINEYLYICRCFSNSRSILLREAVMVYLSVLGGDFILQQVAPLKSAISAPTVFTSPPDF